MSAPTPLAGTPTDAAPRVPLFKRLVERLAGMEDGAIIRAAFFAMLAGTAAVLVLDYQELSGVTATPLETPSQPILPAFDPNSPDTPAGPEVTTDPAALSAPLSLTLRAGSVLEMTGSIDPGASERFAAEVEARGEYIKSVALDSPGGSVPDALAIGTLIRDRGFSTSVASGALCASSCPLILAGGKTRLATAGSAIGVHQIYASAPDGALLTDAAAAGNAMSEAQKTTAAITRYLESMGIGAEVWLHALETPPDRLFYFSPEELTSLKLVTKLTK